MEYLFLYGLSDGQKINMPRNIRQLVATIEFLPRRQSRSFIYTNIYVCVHVFLRYGTGTVQYCAVPYGTVVRYCSVITVR